MTETEKKIKEVIEALEARGVTAASEKVLVATTGLPTPVVRHQLKLLVHENILRTASSDGVVVYGRAAA